MTGRSRGTIRIVAAVLGASNLPLLVAPDRVIGTLAPGAAPPPRWLVRLLGARVLLQQVVVIAAPTRRTVLLSASVDALHAASMVAAARFWPRQRRAATMSAVSAAASAVLQRATAPEE